jgi:hypothetical protein
MPGTKPLPSRARYYGRIARNAAFSGLLILGSLAIGTVGYHVVAGLGWLDAEYNAAMILTGMGPVDPMHTASSKIFASVYALFSGIAFLSSAGVFMAPFVKMFLHRMHLEIDRD